LDVDESAKSVSVFLNHDGAWAHPMSLQVQTMNAFDNIPNNPTGAAVVALALLNVLASVFNLQKSGVKK